MANTLTNLTPDIYAALDVVSRELVGFIPSVARDSTADQVALNQTLRIPISPANAAGATITPAMSLPSASDQTITNSTLTISNQKYYPFSWTGEEQKQMNYGPGFLTLKQYQIAQALRAAVNDIENSIAAAAHKGASRAYGTAGTAAFGSTIGDMAQIRKILDDNGAPLVDRTLVINTAAGANLRSLSNLYKVNENGGADMLRQGILTDIHGINIRESAQIATFTAGAMASATTSVAALTVGQTVLPLATAGTGVVAAGDIITIANDSNKYLVSSVSFAGSNPASGDSITIAAPGLRVAQSSAARAITVVATSARNVGFSRNAILLATRLPAVPAEGDQASDRMVVTDDRSGLSFEFAIYPGYRMNVYHVSVCWGVSVIKPEHVAVLLG